MSQYVEFFVKSKEDNFTRLDAFSRNTLMYQVLSNDLNVPYEKIKKLTPNFLSKAMAILEGYQQERLDDIKQEESKIAMVATFNNSASEKFKIISELQEVLDEYKEILEEIQATMDYLRILKNIANNLNYQDNTGLYCGVEVGAPTINDIIEK